MLWDVCQGELQLKEISGTVYRLVESQEQVATLGYVDTLDEQALLEQMLESTKPVYKEDLSAYHYLLSTLFRYPPLQWRLASVEFMNRVFFMPGQYWCDIG